MSLYRTAVRLRRPGSAGLAEAPDPERRKL